MKKTYSILVSLLLAFATVFVGCNHDVPDETNDDTPTAKTEFTVTFETNEGSEVAAQKVKEGELATLPEDPTKDGFFFAGWYTDAELTKAFDFATPITADITLYAKWSADPVYTVKIVYNDGKTTDGSAKANKDGEYKIAEPKIERKGYKLEGWFAEKEFKTAIDFTKPFSKDTTIYAKWSVINYKITYELNGGTNNADNPATYTVEDEITLKDATNASFRFFTGWYSDSALTKSFVKIEKGSTGDITLYANYSNVDIWTGEVDTGDFEESLKIEKEKLADLTTSDVLCIIGGPTELKSYHQIALKSGAEGWPTLKAITATLGGNEYDCINFGGIIKFSFGAEDLATIKANGLVIQGVSVKLTKVKIYKEKAPVVLVEEGTTYTNCAGRSLSELDGYSDDAVYNITLTASKENCTTKGYGVGCLVAWDEGYSGDMKQINSVAPVADEDLLTNKTTVCKIPVKTIKDAIAALEGTDKVGYGWNTWNDCSITGLSIVDIY